MKTLFELLLEDASDFIYSTKMLGEDNPTIVVQWKDGDEHLLKINFVDNIPHISVRDTDTSALLFTGEMMGFYEWYYNRGKEN